MQPSDARSLATSAAGFLADVLASLPDQGAQAGASMLPFGSVGDGSLGGEDWFGAGDGGNWFLASRSTATTTDADAATITSRLDRMDMSNTFDSEAVRLV